jgi:hypothetical protein
MKKGALLTVRPFCLSSLLSVACFDFALFGFASVGSAAFGWFRGLRLARCAALTLHQPLLPRDAHDEADRDP